MNRYRQSKDKPTCGQSGLALVDSQISHSPTANFSYIMEKLYICALHKNLALTILRKEKKTVIWTSLKTHSLQVLKPARVWRRKFD